MCCVCCVLCVCCVVMCVWYSTQIFGCWNRNFEIKKRARLSVQSGEVFFLFWAPAPLLGMERWTGRNGYDGTIWRNKSRRIWTRRGRKSMAPTINTYAIPSTHSPPSVLRSERSICYQEMVRKGWLAWWIIPTLRWDAYSYTQPLLQSCILSSVKNPRFTQ